MSSNQNVLNAAVSLGEALKQFDSERSKGADTSLSRRSVQKAIVTLRRSHASLRLEQLRDHSDAVKAVRKLQTAKIALSNSQFLEAQCSYLVEKFNSVQCPEFEKVFPSLPSVEEYTAQHKDEPDFVPYGTDQHQFMLNMLASELEDRNRMEEGLIELHNKECIVKKQIASKKEFLQSLAGKLYELNRGVEGLAKFLEKSND